MAKHVRADVRDVRKVEVNVPCCVCGSSTNTPFLETRYPEFHYPGTFTLRRCHDCGLLFNSPRLTERNLQDLHDRNADLLYRRDADELVRAVATHARTTALVSQRLKRRVVLQAGSARGHYLAVLRAMGWTVQGVDVSPVVTYARTRFGVPTYHGSLETFAARSVGREFPLLLAIDLLERAPDPSQFLSAAATVLEEDGTFILDTPNAASANMAAAGADWPGYHPFQTFLFSAETITTLLGQHGFTVERLFSYGNAARHPAGRHRHRVLRPTFGLLTTARSLARRIRGNLDHLTTNPDWLVRRTAARAATARPYPATTDSADVLAGACAGDNLVVIARKRSRPAARGNDPIRWRYDGRLNA